MVGLSAAGGADEVIARIHKEEEMAELTDADRNRLRQMVEESWVNAALARDWNGCLALCSDDLAYMPPDSPALHGKAQTLGFFEAFPTIRRFRQSVEAIAGDTNVAVMRCSFSLSAEGEDGELSGDGKVLGAASKSSGDWLFTAVCFNWDAPLG